MFAHGKSAFHTFKERHFEGYNELETVKSIKSFLKEAGLGLPWGGQPCPSEVTQEGVWFKRVILLVLSTPLLFFLKCLWLSVMN